MNADRVVDVGIYIDNKLVAGQQSASLVRSMSPIDITNKIDSNWTQSIGGLKSWRVSCSGAYMASAEAYAELEIAYTNNAPVTVLIQDQCRKYTGQALIVSFPLSIVFANHYTYSLELLGTGALNEQSRSNDEGD